MKPVLSTVAAVALTLMLAACAPKRETGTPAAAVTPETTALHQKLVALIPSLKVENIRPTAAAGLYEVEDSGNFGYVTADGKYLIAGDLIELSSGESLTENRRKSDRVARLDKLGEANMIVFAPESGAKHVVTVFTDIDCGYCRKLHSEIARYNAAGITVRYVAYPRSGPDTESFRKAQSVWCAADRKAALTLAKSGMPVTGPSTCSNPVAQEWALGNELGLRGTPLLVLEDGSIVNGYVPAEALAQRLEQHPSAKLSSLSVAPRG